VEEDVGWHGWEDLDGAFVVVVSLCVDFDVWGDFGRFSVDSCLVAVSDAKLEDAC